VPHPVLRLLPLPAPLRLVARRLRVLHLLQVLRRRPRKSKAKAALAPPRFSSALFAQERRRRITPCCFSSVSAIPVSVTSATATI